MPETDPLDATRSAYDAVAADHAGLLVRHGFAVEEALERPAGGHERQPQGFVLAHRG